MSSKIPIVVYRDGLLAYSETFVRDQAEGLERFVPFYAGSRRVEGLDLPGERTVVVNGGGPFGKTAEALYKLRGAAPGFYRRLERLGPALVHAHFGPDGVSAMPLARRLGVPLLTTFHGFDATMTDEYARRSFYRHRAYLRGRPALQREGRLFLAVSEYIKGRLVEVGFPPEKIVVHYNGVDTRLFRPEPGAERGPVVLFVGRLVEKKGCEFLVRAMSRVQEAVPEAELAVIGTGPLRAPLEELAGKTLRRYRFLGALPPGEVRSWMGRASVLSVPSVTASTGDAEGFGLVFAEAQATGLPVASFDGGPIPEVVAHGETGFLAKEGDWEGLASHISRLLEDGDLRRRMGERGVERVRERFDLRERTHALEEIYASVLR
ncbi:glycosyltransferase [Rubrobacter marinus]|uniref:Glycosyltransferase n=1 Tax=Rubrobacter marinus TaxID=2653852 RepID=A0A6G8Q1A1_9ACTN|nr:glycosyltransferase [Rubrobacter marinus]QIN80252.1 glycosyltransferase [Rubrobacter marinus]